MDRTKSGNKITVQRSGCDFEQRKTFAVEAGALARLPRQPKVISECVIRTLWINDHFAQQTRLYIKYYTTAAAKKSIRLFRLTSKSDDPPAAHVSAESQSH